ncbi:MAG: hypothetical protein ACSNEK_05320 [Parachlamydiaceae bacterium]
MERRALYNSLRMSWLLDPHIPVQPWQVENYRELTLEELFQRLQLHHINVDRFAFSQLAENCDTPEELTEVLVQEGETEENDDQIHLVIFELWRRLIPEKQSLSILCDELDYQIYLYDSGQLESVEGMEVALANLQILLEDVNTVKAKALFSSIAEGCANDIEDFLFDYIQTQIDHQNLSYAQELIEGFIPYTQDKKWFEFLKIEILHATDQEEAVQLLESLVKVKNQDLEFNFEVLSFLAKSSHEKLFKSLAKQTFYLLELEEDFIDLANICADFFHFSDQDQNEKEIEMFLSNRNQKSPEATFHSRESQAKEFLKIIS